ncbi:MAG TPA: imidazole glycerol phosphate synthase subunit HisH [Anaerolineales bacterium]
MIALIDYGIGNLRSVEKALMAVGCHVSLTCQTSEILSADKVVLPGVGAFGDGMQGLRQRGLVEAIEAVVEARKPLLGICLGMQLLFEVSYELGVHPGLGLLPGEVRRFESNDLKVPQTGWNQIRPRRESRLLNGLAPNSYAYFNHSYYCQPADPGDILASSEYGVDYASVVGRDGLYGVQFHPEKSQAVGLQILRNFVERC